MTNAGWVYAAVVAFFACLLSLTRKSVVIPQHRTLIIAGLIFAILVTSSLVNASTFLEERWIQRYIAALLFLGFIQFFKSEKDISDFLRLPVSVFVLFLCVESLYQYLFVCSATVPPSCYASRLWNINMMAQVLALSLPFLSLFRSGASNKIQWPLDLLISVATVVIILSGCRSSILAACVFYGLQFTCPTTMSRRRALAVAAIAAAILCPILLTSGKTLAPAGEEKNFSANYRMEVWKQTLALGVDHPLGLGVNNFEFGFLPYKRESKIGTAPSEVDKSPHNEPLRILAEDGWAMFLTTIVLIVLVLVNVVRQIRQGQLSFFLFLSLVAMPEFLFQFPTEMVVPVFLFAAAGASAIHLPVRTIRFAYWAKAVALTIATGVLLLIVVRTTPVVSPRHSAMFCALFPDNWKACGDYFKAHFEAGNLRAAAEALNPVIRRQPFNFIALHFKSMIANESEAAVLACNYAALFRGQASLPGFDISGCDPQMERDLLIRRFETYSRLHE